MFRLPELWPNHEIIWNLQSRLRISLHRSWKAMRSWFAALMTSKCRPDARPPWKTLQALQRLQTLKSLKLEFLSGLVHLCKLCKCKIYVNVCQSRVSFLLALQVGKAPMPRALTLTHGKPTEAIRPAWPWTMDRLSFALMKRIHTRRIK